MDEKLPKLASGQEIPPTVIVVLLTDPKAVPKSVMTKFPKVGNDTELTEVITGGGKTTVSRKGICNELMEELFLDVAKTQTKYVPIGGVTIRTEAVVRLGELVLLA